MPSCPCTPVWGPPERCPVPAVTLCLEQGKVRGVQGAEEREKEGSSWNLGRGGEGGGAESHDSGWDLCGSPCDTGQGTGWGWGVGGRVDAAPPPRSRWAGGPAAQTGRAERRGGLALQGGPAAPHSWDCRCAPRSHFSSCPPHLWGWVRSLSPHAGGRGAEMCPQKMCSSTDPCSWERDLIWEKSWWTEVKDLEGIPSWM